MNIYSVKRRTSTWTLILLLISIFIFLTVIFRVAFPDPPDYSLIYPDDEESSLHHHTLIPSLPKCWGNVLVQINMVLA